MNLLAVNPWIIDCAAYDFWLKPYGFLVILTYLKRKKPNINIEYIDCLEKIKRDRFGRGKYPEEIIPQPPVLKGVKRYFKRYGITPQEFQRRLKNEEKDFILISSSMTYWYPGVFEVIKILKEKYPKTPIILGGTYPTLCFNHANKFSQADFVFKADKLQDFFNLLGVEFDFSELFSTLPDYNYFYSQLDYVVLRTSWGCPFNCSYCAIKRLFKGFFKVPEEKILNFILNYYQKGIRDFVFYDEALLYEQSSIKKLLSQLKKLKLSLRFHTPNALHLRFLDKEVAVLLKETNFVNPHFGLETLNPTLQKEWGDKVNIEDLTRAIKILKKAGFKEGEFSVYLLLGFPNQDLKELKKEAEFLHQQGARVSLAEFSPVPGTKLYQFYKKELSEPLFQNNSLFYFLRKKDLKEIFQIKDYVRRLNREFTSTS